VHPTYLHEEGVNANKISEKLEKMGYKLFKLGRGYNGRSKKEIKIPSKFDPKNNITLHASK
jgi:hypothetical protein